MVAMAEELGVEMAIRSLEHLLQYGEQNIRRAVPLALGLLCISNPKVRSGLASLHFIMFAAVYFFSVKVKLINLAMKNMNCSSNYYIIRVQDLTFDNLC